MASSAGGVVIDFVWLNQALADPKHRSEALKQLYDLLDHSSILKGVDKAVAKDLVQQTVLSMWQLVNNGGAIPNTTYLLRSLTNKKVDFFRRQQRQLTRETEAFRQQATAQNEAQAAADGELTAATVKEAFDKVRDRAIENRRPHLRDKLRADCEQIWDLAAGVREMKTEIEAELAKGNPSDSHVTVRDRLQKRHQQARLALDGALKDLIAAGEIPNDQRVFYEMILQKLLRRQNKRPRASREQV